VQCSSNKNREVPRIKQPKQIIPFSTAQKKTDRKTHFSGLINQFNIDMQISIQSGSNHCSETTRTKKIKFTEESIWWERRMK
jgi:hypothetical protein